MEVLFKAEPTDHDTAIEKAKAIIDNIMRVDCVHITSEEREWYLDELEEIKDHIDVYLKHNKVYRGY
jgi:hypothetical protein